MLNVQIHNKISAIMTLTERKISHFIKVGCAKFSAYPNDNSLLSHPIKPLILGFVKVIEI